MNGNFIVLMSGVSVNFEGIVYSGTIIFVIFVLNINNNMFMLVIYSVVFSSMVLCINIVGLLLIMLVNGN